MKVRYLGPYSQVEIASTGQVAVQGESVDVEAKIARALCRQSSWEKVESKPKKDEKEST